jgi:hypothetical protein
MSHFLNIRTQIREREHLVQALRDLHHQFQISPTQTNDLVVRGYQGNRERAEIVVATGTDYDIGFQKKTDCYEICADWWGVEKGLIKQQTFVQQLNRQYAYNIIRDQARIDDRVFAEEQLPDGALRITVSERH